MSDTVQEQAKPFWFADEKKSMRDQIWQAVSQNQNADTAIITLACVSDAMLWLLSFFFAPPLFSVAADAMWSDWESNYSADLDWNCLLFQQQVSKRSRMHGFFFRDIDDLS